MPYFKIIFQHDPRGIGKSYEKRHSEYPGCMLIIEPETSQIQNSTANNYTAALGE
jgi:hypothetical protein